MVKVKFIIETDVLVEPNLVIHYIEECIRALTGDCLIEAPKGYIKIKKEVETLKDGKAN